MITYVALLRSINVGGNNHVPMAQLRAAIEAIGFRDVKTYIHSGNVVFRCDDEAESSVAARLEGVVAGFAAVRVIVRTASELAALVEGEAPFPTSDGKKLHVVFLRDIPDRVALDPDRSPGDQFVVKGREVWMYLPNGAAKTKLGLPWFEKGLGTVGTARNWNTVLKLLAMTRAL
jgi:uncharacterized protein (DUF1697 family)